MVTIDTALPRRLLDADVTVGEPTHDRMTLEERHASRAALIAEYEREARRPFRRASRAYWRLRYRVLRPIRWTYSHYEGWLWQREIRSYRR